MGLVIECKADALEIKSRSGPAADLVAAVTAAAEGIMV
jgi:hypothetical protein